MDASLPYDNIEELATLLEKTFKGDDLEVKQASEILFQMNKNVVRFTESLMRLVATEQSDKKIMNVKNSACLMMSTLIENVRDKKSFIPAREYVLEAILKTINSRSVYMTLKLTLQKALDELYKADNSRELRNKSLLFIKENMRTGALNEYSASYLILQCIVGTQSSNAVIADYFRNIQEEFVFSGSNLITGIVAEIKEALNDPNPNEKFSNIFLGFRALRVWAATLNTIIGRLGRKTKTKELHFEYVQTVSGYGPVLEVLSSILMLQVPTPKQIPQCLFSTSGITGVDQALNGMKIYVLRCFTKVLRFASNCKILKDLEKNKFYAFSLNTGLEGIMQSLFAFCENPDINVEKALEDLDLEECLVECLNFLTYFTGEQGLYNVFSQCHKRLLMNVCLPILRARPSELEKFEMNPEEFVQFNVDVCHEQESQVAKTEAARLLEHLCDDIDGAATFLVNALLAIMDHSLMGNDPQAISEKYKILEDYRGSVFIAKTEPKIKMETSIIALTIISYIVLDREDLIETLENFLGNYHEYFYTDKSDVLIRCRMCLLVDYYFDILFRKQAAKELSALQLKFVIECATIENPDLRALSEQGIEALSHIFSMEKNRPRLGPYIDEIVRRISAFSAVAQNKAFFTVIQEILSHFRKRLLAKPELIGMLIDGLVKRLLVSYPDGKKPRNNVKTIVSQIWNIITDVANDSKFIPAYQYDIEKVMEPLFVALHENDEVPFETDLLYYVEIVTKRSKAVSPSCWGALKEFPKIFMRYKQLMSSLLPAMNQIIINGKEVLSKDPDTVQVLIEMALEGLKPKHSKANDANSCEAALLLQLIFQYLAPAVSNQNWERIIVRCLNELSETEKTYLQIKLGGVILCGFLSNFQLTYAIVHNQDKMTYLMNLYLGEAASHEYAYDRKLLLLGLTSFLINGLQDPVVSERIMQIFNVLISFLKYVEILEQKRAQWKAENEAHENEEAKQEEEEEFITVPKEVLEKFLSSTNDEQMQDTIQSTGMGLEEPRGGQAEGEDGEYEEVKTTGQDKEYLTDAEQHELKEIMEYFVSGINTQDEFAAFRQAVFALKESHEGDLRSLLEQLPESKKEYLRGVFNSQRVVVKEKSGNTETEARKIVRVRARKVATNVSFPHENEEEM